MDPKGSPTAATAALDGFPPGVRVLFEETSGDAGVVLVDTGSAGTPYPYEVVCERRDGRWVEVAGANGPGWREPAGRGLVTFWGEVGTREDPVAVEYAGRTMRPAVADGYFFAVFWDVPEPGPTWPRIAGEAAG